MPATTCPTYPLMMHPQAGYSAVPSGTAVPVGIAYVPATTDAAVGTMYPAMQQACAYYPASYLAAIQAQQQRIALQTDFTEEPVYVNAKQYAAILRRREQRAKAEAGVFGTLVQTRARTTELCVPTQKISLSKHANPTCTSHGMPTPRGGSGDPVAAF